MRYYETLYIANPNYEQDRLVQLMESVLNQFQEESRAGKFKFLEIFQVSLFQP